VGEKLRITPLRSLPDQTAATVVVAYTADPRGALAHTAWVPTPDGFAVCPQPNSAHTVFRDSAASTDQYIAVASEVSGQNLSGLLRDWLYGTKSPRMPGHPDWTVTPASASLVAPNGRTSGHYHDNSATL
jgi:hypothetical protein